ncbi:MAG: hypothetical protein NTV63_01845 [Candidatus Woesearchaeota archaeon]|nr:hypothetical protein [Candidatus Woesearchaeota archaeon]
MAKNEYSDSEIIVVEKACPVCGSDVKGNEKMRFYCKRCNILFERGELSSGKERNDEAEEKTKRTEKRNVPEKAKEEVKMEEEEEIFITSAKAKRYHVKNCPFAGKIAEDKRIIFRSKEDAKNQGYKPCPCTKKKS